MAMVNCQECGKSISSKAVACPHCGFKPEKDKVGCARVVVIGFVAVLASAVALSMCSPNAPRTEVSAQEDQEFKEAVGAIVYLRDRMKNPASFELVSAVRTPSGTLCIVYRGTNSFNAIETQRYTVNNVVSSSSDAHWQAYCAGQGGRDVSSARHALP